jgi:hypothetical protein
MAGRSVHPISVSLPNPHLRRPIFVPSRSIARIVAFAALVLLPSSRGSAKAQQDVAQVDPTALVRQAIQLRLDEEKNHHPLQYMLRKVDEHHDTTKLIIETKDGDVARLIAIDGKPLSAGANQAELASLDNLAQHPELQERRHRIEQRDADRITHMLGQLPNAFIYRSEGIVPCPSGQCYHLTYTANPHYQPPDTECKIFRGVAGEVWIDQAQQRLTRLDAHFLTDVDFALGILGRVNQGGTVGLQQNDIGGSDWELTRLQMHVTGEILIFKSFSSQMHEEMSHFAPVAPGIGYRDAIEMLKKYDPAQSAYTP